MDFGNMCTQNGMIWYISQVLAFGTVVLSFTPTRHKETGTRGRAGPKPEARRQMQISFSLTATFVSDFCPWQHLFQICGQFCGEEIPITMVANGRPQAR